MFIRLGVRLAPTRSSRGAIEALGQARFDEIVAEGRTLSVQQALARVAR